MSNTTFTIKTMHGAEGEWRSLIATDGVVYSLPPDKGEGVKIKVGGTYAVKIFTKQKDGKTKHYIQGIEAESAYDIGVTALPPRPSISNNEPEKPSMKDIQIRMMHSSNYATNKANTVMSFEVERMKAMGTLEKINGSEFKALYDSVWDEAYKESMERLTGEL